MKSLIFIIGIILSVNAFAQKIWILPPQQIPPADGISYSQYILEKNTATGPDNEVVEWAQSILNANSLNRDLDNQVEEIFAKFKLNHFNRKVLLDLLNKIILKANIDQKKELQKRACQLAALDTNSSDFVFYKCETNYLPINELFKTYSKLEAILLEDLKIIKTDLPHLQINKESKYHWKLISNSHKEILFFGSFKDLQRQSFQFDELVSGNCQSYTTHFDDLNLLSRGSIYFNSECQIDLAKKSIDDNQSWIKKNQHWLIPSAILAVGIIAYQFKDKKLVINY